MTGQKSLEIVKDFDSQIGVDRTIITKVDSNSRAGCALSLRWITKKTVSFCATGEKVEDLEPFIASRIASRIVGYGDIATLSEKIESQIKKNKNLNNMSAMAERIMKGTFNLEDFLKQIELVNSMGSIKRLISYLPGMNAISHSQLEDGEQEIVRFKALIQSMTPKERIYPALIDKSKSRKKRICMGSGCKIKDLERLLEKFEQSRRFAKILSGFKR